MARSGFRTFAIFATTCGEPPLRRFKRAIGVGEWSISSYAGARNSAFADNAVRQLLDEINGYFCELAIRYFCALGWCDELEKAELSPIRRAVAPAIS